MCEVIFNLTWGNFSMNTFKQYCIPFMANFIYGFIILIVVCIVFTGIDGILAFIKSSWLKISLYSSLISISLIVYNYRKQRKIKVS